MTSDDGPSRGSNEISAAVWPWSRPDCARDYSPNGPELPAEGGRSLEACNGSGGNPSPPPPPPWGCGKWFIRQSRLGTVNQVLPSGEPGGGAATATSGRGQVAGAYGWERHGVSFPKQGTGRRAQSTELRHTTASIEKPRQRRGFSWFQSVVSGENSFFAPYYQDTKSSTKTGQISLRV